MYSNFLNNFHLLYAFYDLNYRFNHLIYTHFRFHPLDFRSISKHHFDIICQQYLPSIVDRITSFCLSDSNETPNQLKLFYSYRFNINQFSHLQSLTLDSIQSWNLLIKITFECHDLQYLTHLNIIDNYDEISNVCVTDSLIRNIWNLSKLTHCNLNRIHRNGHCPDEFSVVSSSIKYLSINQSFNNLDIVFDLFQHTPYLQQLITKISSYTSYVPRQVIAASMTTFKCVYAGDKQLLIILFQNMPNLSKLILEIDDIYWNGYDWERILTKHLPNIKIFRFKMDFEFSHHNDIEIQVNELLDSFRTSFWFDKHQWFVRCHWIPSSEDIKYNYNMIYTLPYAFKSFIYSKKYRVKSTCPNEKDYCTYNSVQTILRNSRIRYLDEDIPPFRLPYLRHCSIRQFLNDELWIYNSSLSKLTSLVIECFSEQNTYDQLQALVHKAPQLSSLIFIGSITESMELFKLTNTSIRLLDFKNICTSTDEYFNYTDCIALANSSLGQQCQSLIIRVKDRIDVLYLAQNMPNLRSLIVQCIKENWTDYRLLHDNLPLTYSIILYPIFSKLPVRLWISEEMPKIKKRVYLWNFFKKWRLFAKCLPYRCVS